MPRKISKEYLGLVSRVSELDYLLGTKQDGKSFRFDIKQKIISEDTGSLFDCNDFSKKKSTNSNYSHSLASRTDYVLSLLADFYSQLEKQSSQGNVTIGDCDALALYFKGKSGLEFVLTDDSSKKYVILTSKGLNLFRQIWCSGRNYESTREEIPFSKIRSGNNADIVLEDGLATIVDKRTREPSLLLYNTTESVGMTEEYKTHDRNVVGSRNSIRRIF